MLVLVLWASVVVFWALCWPPRAAFLITSANKVVLRQLRLADGMGLEGLEENRMQETEEWGSLWLGRRTKRK